MPDPGDAPATDSNDASTTEPDEVDESEPQPKACRVCGAEIDLAAWHPAAAGVDDEFNLYVFCSATCRNEWTDD